MAQNIFFTDKGKQVTVNRDPSNNLPLSIELSDGKLSVTKLEKILKLSNPLNILDMHTAIAIVAYLWNNGEEQLEIDGFAIFYSGEDSEAISILQTGAETPQNISLSYDIIIKGIDVYQYTINSNNKTSYGIHLSSSEIEYLEPTQLNRYNNDRYKDYLQERDIPEQTLVPELYIEETEKQIQAYEMKKLKKKLNPYRKEIKDAILYAKEQKALGNDQEVKEVVAHVRSLEEFIKKELTDFHDANKEENSHPISVWEILQMTFDLSVTKTLIDLDSGQAAVDELVLTPPKAAKRMAHILSPEIPTQPYLEEVSPEATSPALKKIKPTPLQDKGKNPHALHSLSDEGYDNITTKAQSTKQILPYDIDGRIDQENMPPMTPDLENDYNYASFLGISNE